MATLILTLALASDGTVDEDASLATCRSEIRKYKAARETEQEVIGEAVGSLFDEHKGATLNMPYVVNQACRKLNVQPESFKTISERVAEYVRANSQGKKAEDGSVERPDSMFVINKGKGGGVTRRCDAPAPESK